MATSSPTAPVFQAPACPEWCIAKHDTEEDGPITHHDGPVFGGVETVWDFDGTVGEWSIYVPDSDHYSEQARDGQYAPSEALALAHDIQSAVAWIKALA